MKLFYLDFWANAMYGGMSYGDTQTMNWFDELDSWGGMEGEWEFITDYWVEIPGGGLLP